jgi:TolB-like protein/DNA-binding winged helix-turn-helix (wHTH) protein/Tfp pilus assembly protein PilF
MTQRLRFGEDFELDPGTYQLYRSGRALKLERIPMEILLLLTERPGELITREHIVERIWGKGHFLDTDNSINGAIRKIRQLLHDDSEQPQYIQTITGRGYRFIAPVVGAEQPAPPAIQPRRRAWSGALVALPVLLVAVVWLWTRASGSSAGKVTLAVLPFQNLTGDAAQEYFSDGLTEEMIAQLGSIDPQRLQVIARTSVMHYKTGPPPLPQIARELGVQYVLEGSVRRDRNGVRVSAQLIEVKDQTHIWAQQYDRQLTELLTLQSEIVQAIADEIQVHLGNPARAANRAPADSGVDYQAYDLYLRGQYFLSKRTIPGFEAAIRYYGLAIARDSGFARAYAALANAYELLTLYSGGSVTLVREARAAARKALELDPRSPEAHTAFALIVQVHDWDLRTAELEFRRAIALNPNYATAHHWYAEHLMLRGRFEEALEESERARQLDPLSLIIAVDHGVLLFYAGQYDRAIAQFRSVMAMDPYFPRADYIQAAYLENGMVTEALAFVEDRRDRMPPLGYWGNLTCIYGRSGQIAKAREAMDSALQILRHDPVEPAIMAGLFACVGDKEQTLALLEKGYAEHGAMLGLRIHPPFDFLRGDPRFQDLVRRVGLDR